MLTAEERLEQLDKTLQELEELSESRPVIVEGVRDVAALKKLGITKNIFHLNKGKSIFSFCEDLSKRWPATVILTDWDRRGGRLAKMLKEGFEANGVKANDKIRSQIAVVTMKEVKDIES